MILSRREALAIAGAAGLSLFARGTDAQEPQRTCVVRPRQTEGPYFIDEMLNRSDIRTDPTNGEVSAGSPFDLTFNVGRLSAGRCEPLPGAMVDIWQCNWQGAYAGVRDPQFGDTTGKKFLRGYQLTDAAGVARFRTVYPGWYEGRAVHIHFKIRSPREATPAYEFTSQVYFDDAFTDRVHAVLPYSERPSSRRTRNERDGIFRRERGGELLLEVRPSSSGYASSFNVALQV